MPIYNKKTFLVFTFRLSIMFKDFLELYKTNNIIKLFIA